MQEVVFLYLSMHLQYIYIHVTIVIEKRKYQFKSSWDMGEVERNEPGRARRKERDEVSDVILF